MALHLIEQLLAQIMRFGSISRTWRQRRRLYVSAVMRRFVGIDLGREPVPDETTLRCSVLRHGSRVTGLGPGRAGPLL